MIERSSPVDRIPFRSASLEDLVIKPLAFVALGATQQGSAARGLCPRPATWPWPQAASLRSAPAVLPIAVIALATQFVPALGRATPVESLPSTVQASAPRSAQSAEVARQLERLKLQAEESKSFGSTPASARAAWELGLIYLHGAGVRRDAALALLWFQRAARLGREPWAYAGLAWCAIDGCVGPPRVDEAKRNIALLRRQHPVRADYLAWVLASREAPAQLASNRLGQALAPGVPDLALLEQTAAACDVQANLELGIMAADEQRSAEAQRFFERASSRSRAAETNLQILKNDRGAPERSTGPSPTPNADAQAALTQAQRYHRRPGTQANFAEAIHYYQLAASRGSQQARHMLELIDSRPLPGDKINIRWMEQLAYVDPLANFASLPPQNTQMMQRDPTPLFDLMPAFWRRQLTQVER